MHENLESAKIPFTLRMAKTKIMVLVLGFSSLFLPFFKENVVLVSGKSGFSYWFQFCPREGLAYFASFEERPHEIIFSFSGYLLHPLEVIS